MLRPVFDQAKFDNLVLYIASKCSDPTRLGAVRLRKILYFADVLRYAETGEPLTGATYIKRQLGPVPRELDEALRRLRRADALRVKDGVHPAGYPMKHYFALKNPDLRVFDAEEISLVDSVIQTICDEHTATSISYASHHNAWRLAEIGEELPYESFLVARFAEIDEDAVAWAKGEIERYERSSAR
jgi:hypothetical protein